MREVTPASAACQFVFTRVAVRAAAAESPAAR
jgi:hypothetical protein